MQARPALKAARATADFKLVSDWVGEETFWIDAVDDRPARDRAATGGRIAIDRDAAIGPRVAGLVLICLVLFAFAALAGAVGNAAAAPPGPTRIVANSGHLNGVAVDLVPGAFAEMVG